MTALQAVVLVWAVVAVGLGALVQQNWAAVNASWDQLEIDGKFEGVSVGPVARVFYGTVFCLAWPITVPITVWSKYGNKDHDHDHEGE